MQGYVDDQLQPKVKLKTKGMRKAVEISLTESEEALIGSGLLEKQRLTIDYADKVVMIEPKAVSS